MGRVCPSLRSNLAPPRYGMRSAAVAVDNTFVLAIAAGLAAAAPELPSAAVTSLAQTLAARLAPSSWQSYSAAFTRFVRFCSAHDLSPLPAATSTVLWYADFLAHEGRLQAATSQPYFSAINTIHEQLGFEKPAVGVQLTSFLAGWRRRQTVLIPLPSASGMRAMPASVAAVVLDRLPLLHDIYELRASLFFVVSFVTMLRPDSLLSCPSLNASAGRLSFTPSRFKTSTPQLGIECQVDISRLPLLAAALTRFERLRGLGIGASSFWQLACEPPPTTAHAEAWFGLAREGALVLPVFTLYSLRRGAASTAYAAGASLLRIEFMGGWASNSSALRRRYLDLSFPNDSHAQRFFGWLVHNALPVASQPNTFL